MAAPIANNPLAKHFRQPAIYLKLPSGGKYYPPETIELGVTGEIPVYPMTVKDELLLRTPDALMNGESMAEMIRSCCPAIKDPYALPLVDLDAVLIAVRLASYGESIDIDSTCTHCGHENAHSIDLRRVLDSIQPNAAYDQSYNIDGLIFRLQPQIFRDINLVGLISFEQRKLISSIESSELTPEEKKAHFNEVFEKLTDLNIKTLVSCIKSITTEDGTEVGSQELIKDFLINTNRTIYDQVKNLVNTAVEQNKLKPMTINCSECTAEYKLEVDFNQTNFFA